MERAELLGYDVFVFDVDDTLLHTFENGYLKINAAAAQLGYPPITFEQYRACYGTYSFASCIQRWFAAADPAQMAQAYADQAARFPYRPICDFSVVQALLARQGKQAAILTNGANDERLRRKLAVCGTDFSRLAGIWGAEDVPAPKPSPLAVLPIKQRFPGKKILYIGDAETDRRMAADAGIGFLQVATGRDQPSSDTPSVSSLVELITKLRS